MFKHRILGRTIDDAAGEAYDKVAKLLGLPYPGGKLIDDAARKGNPEYHRFPKARIKDSEFDFSFSGIKTSVLYYLRKNFDDKKIDEETMNNICASFQESVTGMLFENTLLAAKRYGVKSIAVSGGVSANSELRRKFYNLRNNGYEIIFPSVEYTADNAAMIGFAGFLKYISSSDHNFNYDNQLQVQAKPRLDYENF